jgi:hypothetical protein
VEASFGRDLPESKRRRGRRLDDYHCAAARFPLITILNEARHNPNLAEDVGLSRLQRTGHALDSH